MGETCLCYLPERLGKHLGDETGRERSRVLRFSLRGGSR